jgi:hypothetical protein
LGRTISTVRNYEQIIQREQEPVPSADFRGVLGVTKKVFFDPSKNTVFLQFLKSGLKDALRSMNMGVW